MKNKNEVTGSDRLIDAVTLEHAIGYLTELRAKNLYDREVWEDIDATIKGLQALPRPEGESVNGELVDALRGLLGWGTLAKLIDPGIAASIEGDEAWTKARAAIKRAEEAGK
jgi:hypothetical protein